MKTIYDMKRKREIPKSVKQKDRKKIPIEKPIKKLNTYDPNADYTIDQLESYLTLLQRLWCREYVVDYNAARATRASGYAESSVKKSALANSKNKIMQRYCRALERDIQKVTGITKVRNLKELAKIAYTDFTDLADGWMNLKDFESLPKQVKAGIKSIDSKTTTDKNGNVISQIKVELHDKKAAIDTINKMMGFNEPDKQEVNTTHTFGTDAIVNIRQVLGLDDK